MSYLFPNPRLAPLLSFPFSSPSSSFSAPGVVTTIISSLCSQPKEPEKGATWTPRIGLVHARHHTLACIVFPGPPGQEFYCPEATCASSDKVPGPSSPLCLPPKGLFDLKKKKKKAYHWCIVCQAKNKRKWTRLFGNNPPPLLLWILEGNFSCWWGFHSVSSFSSYSMVSPPYNLIHPPSSIHLSIHPFLPYFLINYLPCSRYYCRLWRPRMTMLTNPLPHGIYILAGGGRKS